MSYTFDQARIQAADVSALAAHNILVNGFHNISQEIIDTAVSGSTYKTDQWALSYSSAGGSVLTGQRVASPFPSFPAISYGLRATATTSSGGAAGDFAQISQPIEGSRIARLGWGTNGAVPVTIAFVARSSVAAVYYLRVVNAAGNRTFLRRIALAANTDTLVVLNVPGDVSGAWPTGTGQGMTVALSLTSGSVYIGAADAWQSANLVAGADISYFSNVAGTTVTMSAAVMLPGTVPISPSMISLLARHVDDELRLCQRYWMKTYNPGDLPGVISTNALLFSLVLTTTSYAAVTWEFPQEMRVSPSITPYSPMTGAVGKGRDFNNSLDITVSGVNIGTKRAVVQAQNVVMNALTSLYVHATANARM